MKNMELSGLNKFAIKLFCSLLDNYVQSMLISESILSWNYLTRSQSHNCALGQFLTSDSKQVTKGSIFICVNGYEICMQSIFCR